MLMLIFRPICSWDLCCTRKVLSVVKSACCVPLSLTVFPGQEVMRSRPYLQVALGAARCPINLVFPYMLSDVLLMPSTCISFLVALSTHPNQWRQMAAHLDPGSAAGFFQREYILANVCLVLLKWDCWVFSINWIYRTNTSCPGEAASHKENSVWTFCFIVIRSFTTMSMNWNHDAGLTCNLLL